jgi:hypothetical protein
VDTYTPPSSLTEHPHDAVTHTRHGRS